MKRTRCLGVVAFLLAVAVAAEHPAIDRLDELMALIRSGDEARLRTYVGASFSESMQKTGPGDPGILPFLMELANRHRGFDVLRTIAPAPDSVVAVIRSVTQPTRIFRFNLTVDKAPPHLVLGLFILPAQAEDLPKETVTLTPAQAIEAFKKEVERLADSGEFSGVVLLARGNEVVLQKAVGEADRANHIPNTNDTVFGLASMNKMFTAVAVAKLVEQGRLAWSDPVGRHLKGWLPDELAASITVEQLLTHTSGLGDYLDQIETDPKLRSARSLSAYRELVHASKIVGKPEDGLRYSNTGYVVLGALIEAVSGRDYFEFVRSEIFVPAGMTRTDTWCRDEIVEHRAIGYIPPDEAEAMGLGKGWRTNQRFEGTRGTSAGGGMSTAGDLFRFARALTTGKLVKPETLAALVQPRVAFLPGSRYGYGFVVLEGAGPKAFGHSGGFPGVNGELRIYGDEDWTIVVLSNVSGGAGEMSAAWDALARKLAPAKEVIQ
jgi:CubicO group peptidase (beta-lactamase class C family)